MVLTQRFFGALRMTAIAVVLTSRGALLTGQSAAQQTAFELFRDSLAATSDTTALRALLPPLRRSDPVRAGLIGLR